MKIHRVFDILAFQRHNYPQDKAVCLFTEGSWQGMSFAEFCQKIDAASNWLLEMGFQKADKMAIVPLAGKVEWLILDLACQQIGMITVPIHPTSSEKDLLHILSETEPKMGIAADEGLFYKLQLVAQKLNLDIPIYHLDHESPHFLNVLDFPKITKNQLSNLENIKNSIKTDDALAIMYTSGTSGVPKGAILSHANLVSNTLAAMEIFPIRSGESVLSFLPFSHILERSVCYTYLACGVSLHFLHDRDSFSADFQSVRPVFCTMVPRILEKLYGFVQKESLSKNPIRRFLMRRALHLGKKYDPSVSQSFLFRLELFFAKIFILNRWKKQLGGRLNYVAVGAAALKPEIARFFAAAGIQVAEGYGMTETSPLITINRFERGKNKFGTVGLPVKGVEIKIIEPDENGAGEIVVRGANVTRGYYQKPQNTEWVFLEDNWFKTGDIGFIKNGFLTITDRKKDIFKTTSGKYIAPQQLENQLFTSPFVQQSLIIGFNRPFVTALIVPNFDLLEDWCNHHAIHWTSPDYMVHNIKILAMLKKEIDKVNTHLSNNERIRNFTLCAEEWSAETGEMTATLKPLRTVLQQKYGKEIERMYAKEI